MDPANPAPAHPPAAPAEDMTPQRALTLAWAWWIVLLLIPFVLFLITMAALVSREDPGSDALSMGFFLASLLWLRTAIPGAFVLRSHCFKSYWQGRTVEPRSYLRGMVTVWLAMEIGGLIALTGCLVSGQLLPGLMSAAVAFMLFTPFWPSGHAMTDPVGAVDDDEVFRHPR